MTLTEFLNAVLPDTGKYCAVGIKQEKLRTRFATDIPSLITEIQDIYSADADTYYAMFSFDPEITPPRTVSRQRIQSQSILA